MPNIQTLKKTRIELSNFSHEYFTLKKNTLIAQRVSFNLLWHLGTVNYKAFHKLLVASSILHVFPVQQCRHR